MYYGLRNNRRELQKFVKKEHMLWYSRRGGVYLLNKIYADDKVSFSEYLKELREEIRKDTWEKPGE